ncbi:MULTISPECIES: 50S ribosomal protein L37e [Methanoregula]|uniref:Large ribosomal subunit protein eL37 n=1 Tax=Methanoregula boonei (strain DSM 21154 / JCM 14090 / 6A8) TaxID=456442 RepID=RL37_METB6|nr:MULTISPECIES: 50S ribosomal protein L37e [Methanoregula]A7I4F7.1 RecName: Full=Large ribosomal subunit protein eL37; AltName: Full=50S ribosomal protein L37e [Methanoregula boonei 6A8]ABS54618.1 Ribosomal protein L37e [Methanoregula boonei 6A8]HVP96413.1 50S ribosomal protein L37e [Methanoregula sp.]
MSKGTPSMGKMNKMTHIACRRCGRISFHAQKKVCSSCGFGRSTKMQSFKWDTKRPKTPTH